MAIVKLDTLRIICNYLKKRNLIMDLLFKEPTHILISIKKIATLRLLWIIFTVNSINTNAYIGRNLIDSSKLAFL